MMWVDKDLHQQVLDLYDNDQEALMQVYKTFADECESDISQLVYLVNLFCPESNIQSMSEIREQHYKQREEGQDESNSPPNACLIDWHLVDKYAHKLKGRCSQMGFASLAAVACRIVVMARKGHGCHCGVDCWGMLVELVEMAQKEYKMAVMFLYRSLLTNNHLLPQ